MLSVYPVTVNHDLDRSHPLYVGNFFSLTRLRWKTRRGRQNLIISMALTWLRVVTEDKGATGFIEREIYLTQLHRQVSGAKTILEAFFDIKRLGFSMGVENRSPTIIIPKRLGVKLRRAISELIEQVKFDPGPEPTGLLTTSMVSLRRVDTDALRARLVKLGRIDLVAPVSWLLRQVNPVKFYYRSAGNLQARETSYWPIKSIESWPGWLRTELFGTSIDLENAFVQFLVHQLELKYAKNQRALELKYPALLELFRQKAGFRRRVCTELLKLPENTENLKLVKRLIMAISNGSMISATALLARSNRSDAVRLVMAYNTKLSTSELILLGNELSQLSKEFRRARRDLCLFLLNERPSAVGQKRVYTEYFKWERLARHAIWEAVGRTGLHLHDGIDGGVLSVSSQALQKQLMQDHGLQVSVTEA